MDNSEWHLLVAQVTIIVAIMIYLLVVQNLSLTAVLYEWGVPLAALIILFTAYPLYRLIRNLRK